MRTKVWGKLQQAFDRWFGWDIDPETKGALRVDIKLRNRSLTDDIAERMVKGNVSLQRTNRLSQGDIDLRIEDFLKQNDFPNLDS